ncbi:MAG: selenium-dependent molybdenum cofactor biosynthesis protein YqeB [Dehalococcoidia bacterium]|nr:selenium-dependent molybdenum cofactor biosynthesis protein YqeB [Dehalococcoidia bacterium]
MGVRNLKVLIRGGGELASAVACRLAESHFKVIMTDVSAPQAVRRHVSFCEAVYDGYKTVEGRTARLVSSATQSRAAWKAEEMAIIVDPDNTILGDIKPDVVVDAIIAKKNLGTRITDAGLVIGLGIGFEAGRDVHVVIETNRGHNLGRVLRSGIAEPDTGNPGDICGYTFERVMRAPCGGIIRTVKQIGDMVKAGDIVAYVDGESIKTTIPGVIRGLIRDGTPVTKGLKSGDVDPRGRVEYIDTISDKGRTISGGVLEAILAHFNGRSLPSISTI